MALNLQDPYLVYYKNQLGSGVSVVYKGAPYQRGHGIGSFLGGLFRTITPLLKSGAKAVGKEALKAGMNVLGDVISTVPPRQALANRMKEFTGNLKRKADDKLDRTMTGSGTSYKKRKLNVTPQSLQRLLAVRPRRKSVSKRSASTAATKKKRKNNKKVKTSSFKDIFN